MYNNYDNHNIDDIIDNNNNNNHTGLTYSELPPQTETKHLCDILGDLQCLRGWQEIDCGC